MAKNRAGTDGASCANAPEPRSPRHFYPLGIVFWTVRWCQIGPKILRQEESNGPRSLCADFYPASSKVVRTPLVRVPARATKGARHPCRARTRQWRTNARACCSRRSESGWSTSRPRRRRGLARRAIVPLTVPVAVHVCMVPCPSDAKGFLDLPGPGTRDAALSQRRVGAPAVAVGAGLDHAEVSGDGVWSCFSSCVCVTGGARSHALLACAAARSWPGKTINERGEVTYLAEPIAGPLYSAAPHKENWHPSKMHKEPLAKNVADPLAISHEPSFNPNEVNTPGISSRHRVFCILKSECPGRRCSLLFCVSNMASGKQLPSPPPGRPPLQGLHANRKPSNLNSAPSLDIASKDLSRFTLDL